MSVTEDRRGARTKTLAVVVLAALVLVAVAWTLRENRRAVAQAADEARTAAPLKVAEKVHRPVVVVIGDSFGAGSNSNTPDHVWPLLLAESQNWLLFNDSQGGTGYVKDDFGDTFDDRAAADVAKYAADMVVIAGGLNDLQYSPARIEASATAAVEAAKANGAQVVLLSPFQPDYVTPEATEVTATLKAVADREQVDFLDVSSWLVGHSEWIGADHVHPIDAGHDYLAQQMSVNLPPPDWSRVDPEGQFD